MPETEWFCKQCEQELADEEKEEEEERREVEEAQNEEKPNVKESNGTDVSKGNQHRGVNGTNSRSGTPGKRKASEDRQRPKKR